MLSWFVKVRAAADRAARSYVRNEVRRMVAEERRSYERATCNAVYEGLREQLAEHRTQAAERAARQ